MGRFRPFCTSLHNFTLHNFTCLSQGWDWGPSKEGSLCHPKYNQRLCGQEESTSSYWNPLPCRCYACLVSCETHDTQQCYCC